MLPTARKLAFSEVPVVDLGPAETRADGTRRVVAEAIGEACSRVGFFYIKNHGVNASDVAAIFQTAKAFHDLPLEAKMEVCVRNNDHFQGYLPGMTKSNDRRISQTLQEAFQIRRPLAPDDPDLLAGTPLHGMIPWPSAMPDLQPRMMAYYEKVDALGRELLTLFELSLDLPKNTFTRFFRKDMNALRLLHYPPQPPDGPGDLRGTRDHTDTDAFTILAQDMNGGLEIRNKDNEWVAVPPIPDTFVVNVGEILKVWTDGIFSSTVHRVINRSGRERYSVPFFLYPTYEEVIYPILRNPDPANVAPEDLPSSMPRDKPFIWGEFKARNSARIHPRRESAKT
jgi:isopenicillin N synthase-like dioxygenase